jgi:hypothetical protein
MTTATAEMFMRERDEAIRERDADRAELAEIHKAMMDDWMSRESMTAAECVRRLIGERDAARKERDHLRAAIEEHSAQIIMGGLVGATAKDADEALWAALDPSPSPEPPEAA